MLAGWNLGSADAGRGDDKPDGGVIGSPGASRGPEAARDLQARSLTVP